MDIELVPVVAAAPGFETQPLGFRAAFIVAARRVVQLWPALLLMLLGTLLSAGLLALIPALNLVNLAHRPVIADIAAGVRAWQLVDLVGVLSGARSTPGESPVAGELAIVGLAFLAMPLVGGFVSAFLYGGVLLVYKEAPPAFPLGRFLWGCWHWFGANLGLGLVQALLFIALYLPLTGLALFLAQQGPVGMAVAVMMFLLLSLLWLMIFELARTRLVLNDTRNPFRGIGLAFGDLFHRPLPLLGIYAAALLLLLGVHALFRLVINPTVPLDALLLALAVQQGFILARLFCRALRLAGLMVMLKK